MLWLIKVLVHSAHAVKWCRCAHGLQVTHTDVPGEKPKFATQEGQSMYITQCAHYHWFKYGLKIPCLNSYEFLTRVRVKIVQAERWCLLSLSTVHQPNTWFKERCSGTCSADFVISGEAHRSSEGGTSSPVWRGGCQGLPEWGWGAQDPGAAGTGGQGSG